jgi:hypothetical protein
MSFNDDRFGWNRQKFEWSIAAGSSGTKRGVALVDDAITGDPLPDYDGWTAKLELYAGTVLKITKEPTVTGDAGAKTLTIDVSFDPADTESLAPTSPITLHGSVWFSHPSTSEKYTPARIFLKVEPHD